MNTDLKTVAEEAMERANDARHDLLIANIFGDEPEGRKAQRRGVKAAIDLANAIRAGAPLPEDLPEDGVAGFLADYPEGSTVEDALEKIRQVEAAYETEED